MLKRIVVAHKFQLTVYQRVTTAGLTHNHDKTKQKFDKGSPPITHSQTKKNTRTHTHTLPINHLTGKVISFLQKEGTSANAGPHYHKLYARVTHIWGNRGGQSNRSAMKGPRPGRTALLITVPPASGKYA